MRSKRRRCIIFFGFLILFSGCSIFTPYKSSYNCPKGDKGKCVSAKEAYKDSFKKTEESVKDKEETGQKGKKESQEKEAENLYLSSLQKELASLIEDPVTPVVLPPKVIRVLIFQYNNKNVLYMPRFIYMTVGDPIWVMGDYLNASPNSIQK